MSIIEQLEEAKVKGKTLKVTFSINNNDCTGKVDDIVANHVHFKKSDGTKTDFWVGAVEKVELLDKEKLK